MNVPIHFYQPPHGRYCEAVIDDGTVRVSGFSNTALGAVCSVIVNYLFLVSEPVVESSATFEKSASNTGLLSQNETFPS